MRECKDLVQIFIFIFLTPDGHHEKIKNKNEGHFEKKYAR